MGYPKGQVAKLGESYDWLQFAIDEIYRTYGHRTRAGRKSLHKYGQNPSVSTSEEDITPEEMPGIETVLTTNAIDTVSSDNAADTGVSVYIEGMTISSGIYTFVSQTATLDGSNGTTKVVLDTPLAYCSRVRCVAQGDVRVYEDDDTTTPGIPDDASLIHNVGMSGDNTSLKAGTAIAGSNYFVMTRLWASLGRAASTAAADIRLKIANLGDDILGNSFYTDEIFTISLDSPASFKYEPFKIIKPNSILSMTGISSSGTLDVKGGFDGFFLDII